jgi:hypothetical protein
MWSDKLYYLNIYHDKDLSASFDTNTLSTFIKSLPDLRQISKFEFKNAPTLPPLAILLLNANSVTSWSDKDTDNKKTNLITIVCAKENKDKFESLKSTFIKIAAFVDWQLVDEQTDEGIEDFVLWKPEKQTNA